MKEKRIRKQINNLTIRSARNKIQVITPDKRVLEEFDTLKQAEEYARSIKDFKKIKKEPKINTKNINELCKMINEKYGLKSGDIGSIEHYQDMCENSIVQIMNEHRGTRQLMYGTDKSLNQYLRNLLSGDILLKV